MTRPLAAVRGVGDGQATDDAPRHSAVRDVPGRSPPSVAAFALHDARNLLAALSFNLEYLTDVLSGPGVDPEVTEVLGDVSACSVRIGALFLEALGELQQRTAAAPPRGTSSLEVLVSEAVRSMKRRAAARNVVIVTDDAGDGPCGEDSGLIRRVVENLLDNAIRHAPVGSRIEVRSAVRDGKVIVAVADDGPGIEWSKLHRALDPFHAADDGASEPDSRGHFGLGLAFCANVAQTHGGRIDVHNRASGGACFTVVIPAARVASVRPPDGTTTDATTLTPRP